MGGLWTILHLLILLFIRVFSIFLNFQGHDERGSVVLDPLVRKVVRDVVSRKAGGKKYEWGGGEVEWMIELGRGSTALLCLFGSSKELIFWTLRDSLNDFILSDSVVIRDRGGCMWNLERDK